MNNIEKQVIDFVIDHHGLNPKKITIQSNIPNNLGIDGDDAEELIVDFFKAFDIPLDGFNFSFYFYDEMDVIFNPPRMIYRFFKSLVSDYKSPRPTREITIQMLIDSAKAKKWIDPC